MIEYIADDLLSLNKKKLDTVKNKRKLSAEECIVRQISTARFVNHIIITVSDGRH